jgi:hypothetical protein
VAGGIAITGTVTLTAAAPAQGAVVALTSSSDAITLPSTVTVASGATTQTFDIQTTAATLAFNVIVTASYADVSRTATLTIGKLSLESLSLSATSVVGGSPVVGTIALNAPAPAGGVEVALASDSPLARVPASVTIAAGETIQVFGVDTAPSAALTVVSITASLPYSGSSRSAPLTIGRISLEGLTIGVDTVLGGLPVTGAVSLAVAAPADLTIALSSDSAIATVPSTVTVPAGATSQTFEIATANVPPSRTVTVTASYGGASRAARLTVMAYPILDALSCATTTPKPGTSVACSAQLSAPAPPGGWQITISSSDESIAGAVPATIAVPAASTTFQFDVVTAPAATATTAVIRISDIASGLLLYSQAVTVTP